MVFVFCARRMYCLWRIFDLCNELELINFFVSANHLFEGVFMIKEKNGHPLSDLKTTESRYKEHISPTMARLLKFSGYYAQEESAEGVYIYDDKGERYLDCAGGYGVFVLGHRHKRVVDAVRVQLDKMALSSKIFFNPLMAELAEKLSQSCGGNLKYCFFCSSGTEAVEGAIKIARLATGKTRIISTVNSFHGKTMGSLSVSGREVYKNGCGPLLPETIQVPFNDALALKNAIDENTAAFITEPIQGEGGINLPSDGYFAEVRKICSDAGILFIADEIQSGMGRTGRFLALEHWGVKPDLLLLAKGLGGGVMPVGAIVGTPEVWKPFFTNPLIHTSTFGGNELACSAAIATLDVIEEDNLIDHCGKIGRYFLDSLNGVWERYPEIIADVRGLGLMIGVEMKEERFGGSVIYEMARGRVTGVYTLNNQKVIRFEPALIINEQQVDDAVRVFEAAVDKTAKSMLK